MDDREQQEFTRIELIARLEKDRLMTNQYEDHLGFFRKRVENARYRLGRGDSYGQQQHLEHIARLEAIPKPWENPLPTGLAS